MNTPPPHLNTVHLLHQLADILTEVRARALALDRALYSAHEALDFPEHAHALAVAHALDLALFIDRACILVYARVLDRDFARILDRDFARASARARLRGLAKATDRVHTKVVEALTVGDEREQGLARKSTVVVAQAAAKLAVVAAWLQPAGERARYGEEFAAELWDLAQAGARRWQQVLHAIRLLAVGWQLRRELTAPQRTKAAP